jgi:hypothetical protein
VAAAAPRADPADLILLVGVLAAAVLVGFAAVLLTGATPSATSAPLGPSSGVGSPSVTWTEVQLGAGALVAAVVAVVVSRWVGSELVFPTKLAIAGLGLGLAALLAYVLLRLFGHGGNPAGGAQGGTGANGTSNGTGVVPPSVPPPSVGAPFPGPTWFSYALLLAVVVGIAIVVWMVARSGRWAPEEAADTSGPAPARRTLEDALAALERGASEDPRRLLIAVYGRLLARVGPRVGEIAPMTAREIEAGVVARLNVSSVTAHDLTALFEEARYSSHPIGPTELTRARDLLARAIEELSRVPVPAGA